MISYCFNIRVILRWIVRVVVDHQRPRVDVERKSRVALGESVEEAEG